MTPQRYKREPVRDPSGRRTWTVCDPSGLPVDPVDDFLQSLRALHQSPNTVRTYAGSLAFLFTFLTARSLSWDEVETADLTDFMVALRTAVHPLERTRGSGPRSEASVKPAAAAIRRFYDFQRIERGLGPVDLRLTREVSRVGQRSANHFLQHVESARDTYEANVLSHGLSSDAPMPEIINFEGDFERMLSACRSLRDRLLLSALYDLGLRVGGVIGLRHGDLDFAARSVTIRRREDNPNGALTKRRAPFSVYAGQSRFFEFYRDYLLRELTPSGIQSDFVFVNLRPPVGAQVSYNNVYEQVRDIGHRADLGPVHPHMLRHTHATALAKAGWTTSEIAARLGHRSATSAEVYVHLANDDIVRRLDETSNLVWPGVSQEVVS